MYSFCCCFKGAYKLRVFKPITIKMKQFNDTFLSTRYYFVYYRTFLTPLSSRYNYTSVVQVRKQSTKEIRVRQAVERLKGIPPRDLTPK